MKTIESTESLCMMSLVEALEKLETAECIIYGGLDILRIASAIKEGMIGTKILLVYAKMQPEEWILITKNGEFKSTGDNSKL